MTCLLTTILHGAIIVSSRNGPTMNTKPKPDFDAKRKFDPEMVRAIADLIRALTPLVLPIVLVLLAYVLGR